MPSSHSPVPSDSPSSTTHVDHTQELAVKRLSHRKPRCNHSRHGSRTSFSTTASVRSHKEYIDSLPVPTIEELKKIESIQMKKEEEQIRKSLNIEHPRLTEEERDQAAGLIQRNYRGYRERRQMHGMRMDASTRWLEALKEARYRNLTTPRARNSSEIGGSEDSRARPLSSQGASADPTERYPSEARLRWKTVGTIAKRAANDEDSSVASSSEGAELNEERKQRKRLQREERRKAAMTMDLNYWLEMVDVQHRYGSNLRTYHQYWKSQDTKENFFYWLDYGAGRTVDLSGCSRETLDRERVRYLGKEERKAYLVKIDKEGRLCWAKNGARIDTTIKFKDSIQGIVPLDSDVPAYRELEHAVSAQKEDNDPSSCSLCSTARTGDETSHDAAKHYGDELNNAKGVMKVRHVTAATIFNKLLRSSVKKNTWIFVADTNFRLYVGIKQSGAFQHSSFLHGSRISAAGLIKIKNGQLDKLSPLSGHYRPPVASFRAFVHALKEAGVDMSHVSISRSYTVLVGLEAYVKTRRKGKRFVAKLKRGREKIFDPEAVRAREEAAVDQSESAARERDFLRQKQENEEMEHNRANLLLMKKLKIHPRTPKHRSSASRERSERHERSAPREGEGAPDAPGMDRNRS